MFVAFNRAPTINEVDVVATFTSDRTPEHLAASQHRRNLGGVHLYGSMDLIINPAKWNKDWDVNE